MNAENLVDKILENNERICKAIGTGAQWEIWLQVELMTNMLCPGVHGGREVPYPSPNERLHLDTFLQDEQGLLYAIELKVESATNAGTAVLNAARDDVNKISNFSSPVSAKWVLVIGYSIEAKQALCDFYQKNEGVIYKEVVNGIGCMIITVA